MSMTNSQATRKKETLVVGHLSPGHGFSDLQFVRISCKEGILNKYIYNVKRKTIWHPDDILFLEAIGLTMDNRISCIVVPYILLQSLKFPPRKVKGCLACWSGLELSPMAVKGCLTGWPGLGRGARAVKGSLAGWLGWAGLGLGPE